MSQKDKIGEVLVVAGLLAFAYYRYTKMSSAEKEDLHNELKGIGERMLKEFAPQQIKPFLPANWK